MTVAQGCRNGARTQGPAMRETLEHLYARINANAFVPNTENKVMAQKIKLARGKEFTFPKTGGGVVASKYPWDEWFSGDLLLLERSEGTENEKGTIDTITVKKDYEVGNDAMLPKIKTAARKRYKVCQVSRYDADGNRLVNSLIIKARDMTDDEKQAEDILRAEEKAAAKAAKVKDNTPPSTDGTSGS